MSSTIKRKNSDNAMYCIECKIITPTSNVNIKNKIIKLSDASTITRKTTKGICIICGTKKKLSIDVENS
jgi:hypothetical protein